MKFARVVGTRAPRSEAGEAEVAALCEMERASRIEMMEI